MKALACCLLLACVSSFGQVRFGMAAQAVGAPVERLPNAKANKSAATELADASNVISQTKPASNLNTLPSTNKSAIAKSPFSGTGRQRMMSKLEGIRLDKIVFDSMPLQDVLTNLSDQVKKADPEKRGLNFFLNPSPATPDQTNSDIKTVVIKLDHPINDVRVLDALDAIVRTADKPITYRVRDYAIEIGWTTPEDRLRETRSFKADPTTFRQGLEGVTPTRLPPSSDKGVDSNNNAASSLAQVDSVAADVSPRKLAVEKSAPTDVGGYEAQGAGAEKLRVRSFRLDPNSFYESLEKAAQTGGESSDTETVVEP